MKVTFSSQNDSEIQFGQWSKKTDTDFQLFDQWLKYASPLLFQKYHGEPGDESRKTLW